MLSRSKVLLKTSPRTAHRYLRHLYSLLSEVKKISVTIKTINYLYDTCDGDRNKKTNNIDLCTNSREKNHVT